MKVVTSKLKSSERVASPGLSNNPLISDNSQDFSVDESPKKISEKSGSPSRSWAGSPGLKSS